MRIIFHPVSLIVILILVLTGLGWVVLPARLAAQVQSEIAGHAARDFTYGSAGLRFTPELNLVMQDVRLSGSSGLAEPVMTAKELLVPVQFAQLFAGFSGVSEFGLSGADIQVNINELGHANVWIDGSSDAGKTDITASWTVTLQDSRLRYRDVRGLLGFAVNQVSGHLGLGLNGHVNFNGAGDVNDQRFNIVASLVDFRRVFAGGSPLDLNVDGAGTSFLFSGRVATNPALNLAGQGDVSSTDAPRFLNWFGINLNGLNAVHKLIVSGPIESNGDTFSFTKSEIQYGPIKGHGSVGFSVLGERPSLKLDLGLDVLDLDIYQNMAAAHDSWNEKAFDFSDMKKLDVQFQLAANKMIYNHLTTGLGKISGELKNSLLQANFNSADVAGGSAQIELGLDASQELAQLNLDATFGQVQAASVMAALINHSWLTGVADATVKLAGTGRTQAEMISTLHGTLAAKILDGAIANYKSAMRTGTAKFEVADGVAKVKDNDLSLTGEIDILRKALDLQQATQAIKGAWNVPVVSPLP